MESQPKILNSGIILKTFIHVGINSLLKCIFAATQCGYKSSILSELPSTSIPSTSILYVCK